METATGLNVLGTPLKVCSTSPKTGFYRRGFCESGFDDLGRHVICSVMTKAFLDFTRARGNDLSTPRREHGFPGLKPGDSWCLCALRWKEAYEAGVAPGVRLESTHEKALDVVDLDMLLEHAHGAASG